jgi:diguanylate cyclase (GGDEF)-like protein
MNTLFMEYIQALYRRTDRMFAGLMLFQWIAAVAAALWLSPLTWDGPSSRTHLHVWTALLLGGTITLLPVVLAVFRPGAAVTRHTIAVGQMLMSALLIHLTGGRIETHFHVFGSLAFLAFYRDWRVLLTGTVIAALDHLLRGLLWPQSIYGISGLAQWRWLEHAGWVIFEDVFLIMSCMGSVRELRTLCERDARLERVNHELEQKVEARTASLREVNARLEALATTDPLTGLPNHRALVTGIDQEIERSERYGRSCALLFLDLDHFKALNDSCGHAAGDAVLEDLGAVIRQCLRGIDTLGRWGGEEFVALLPETEPEAALEVGERIRAAVAAHTFQAAGGVFMTCSLGIASYPQDAQSRSELVATADRAMYAAKRLGRNQVRVITDPVVETLEEGAENSREEIAMQGTVEALASLVEARDAYTAEHTKGVADMSVQLARLLGAGVAEAHLVELISKLHDVGKVAIPDLILQKPTRLTEEEWALMRMHPVIGAEVVSRVPALRVTAPGIRGHHERWDGSGYPDGLAGEAIPLTARIVAVADAYSAMTTDRPYRKALSQAEAMAELRRCAGSQFDPSVVQALETLMAQREKAPSLQRAA